jgi:hypothetical protein
MSLVVRPVPILFVRCVATPGTCRRCSTAAIPPRSGACPTSLRCRPSSPICSSAARSSSSISISRLCLSPQSTARRSGARRRRLRQRRRRQRRFCVDHHCHHGVDNDGIWIGSGCPCCDASAAADELPPSRCDADADLLDDDGSTTEEDLELHAAAEREADRATRRRGGRCRYCCCRRQGRGGGEGCQGARRRRGQGACRRRSQGARLRRTRVPLPRPRLGPRRRRVRASRRRSASDACDSWRASKVRFRPTVGAARRFRLSCVRLTAATTCATSGCLSRRSATWRAPKRCMFTVTRNALGVWRCHAKLTTPGRYGVSVTSANADSAWLHGELRCAPGRATTVRVTRRRRRRAARRAERAVARAAGCVWQCDGARDESPPRRATRRHWRRVARERRAPHARRAGGARRQRRRVSCRVFPDARRRLRGACADAWRRHHVGAARVCECCGINRTTTTAAGATAR